MKTMEKLTKRFNRMNHDYKATFHAEWSYKGHYAVAISQQFGLYISAIYHFATCREFMEWMDGVVLD